MRICYIADGTSIHAQRILNHFASRGHEVHLICWKIIPGYDSSVHIHMLPRIAPEILPGFQYLSFLFWIVQVRRLVRRIKPDVVDGHFITVYGFLAACSGFHPLVVTAWGSDIFIQPRRNPLLKLIAKYTLARADLAVCLFPISMAQDAISGLVSNLGKVRSIMLGVDTDKFRPTQDNEGLRQTLRINKSQPTIINTRSLAPIYDVGTLIKAIPLILVKIPQAKFLIVRKPEEKEYSEALLRGLGALDSVRFIDWIPHVELPKHLSLADIYVSTSLSDGASNSLFEAMACGLAPVVTNIPANRPWIKDGENGFLFPPGDYKTLASKVVCLITDVERRKSFAIKNREIVKQKAEHKVEMDKLGSAYQELLLERRR